MNKEEKNSTKCPICGRPTHKESKYCIFHAGAQEKTEKEFKEALKEYTNSIKKENKDYDFRRFIFIGDINFKEDLNVTIFKNAGFRKATFEGRADFRKATFEGYAIFIEATFKGYANFIEATFKRNAGFKKANFEGYTDFGAVTFKEYANFIEATFKGGAGFRKVTFKGYADFIEATFKGQVDFGAVTFKRHADFRKVNFEDDADFRLKYSVGIAHFSRIKVFSGKKLFIRLNNKGGEISFERAYLENTDLDIELVEGILIDFTDALLRNTKIQRDQIENHILQEEKKEFSKAQQVFLLLKNNFHSIGQYENESWAYKKEKDMDRLSHSYPFYMKELKKKDKKEKLPFLKWIKKGNFKKWIISVFSNMIYGYGERPWNVVKTAVVIIIIFALSFSLIGIGKPEIIELKVTGIYQNSGNIVDLAIKGFFENSEIRNFPDSLYFSLITFTTLGYGDFRPLEGLGRILAGSEAFLGAIMMALFVYTFARRTGGR